MSTAALIVLVTGGSLLLAVAAVGGLIARHLYRIEHAQDGDD